MMILSPLRKRAFTLIEMLIVIVIIGILAAALVPRLVDVQSRARNVQRTTDISTIRTAVSIYYSDYSNYPRSLNHLVTGNILSAIPKDPQASARHPCFFRPEGRGTDPLAGGLYYTSGFYDVETVYGVPHLDNSVSHKGYLYASCAGGTVCDYAFLGGMMENDGTTNSYGATLGTGVYHACFRGRNYGEWNGDGAHGKYNAYLQMINEARGGLNSKGKLFLHVWQKGELAF